MDDTDNGDDYVGYGSPPKHGQFKKGQSGNASGRPRNSKNRRTVIVKVMGERISWVEAKQPYEGTKLELLIRTIAQKAARGNMKALKLERQLRGYCQDEELPQANGVLITGPELSQEEWLEKYGSGSQFFAEREKSNSELFKLAVGSSARAEPPASV